MFAKVIQVVLLQMGNLGLWQINLTEERWFMKSCGATLNMEVSLYTTLAVLTC